MKNDETKFGVEIIGGNNDINIDASVFDNIVGQTEAIKKIKFFVQSHSNETPLPTMLFTGSQGLGKSFMAEKVAKAMGRELIEINCGGIKSVDDFVSRVVFGKMLGKRSKTILLDESHEISSDITTFLLTMLNPNKHNKSKTDYQGVELIVDFSKVNIIFATTDAHKMFKPLVNRCAEIYFNLYNNAELYDILKVYANNIKFNCDKEDLSYACRGRARDAFLLSQNVIRYCKMNDVSILDDEGWNSLKDIFSINEYGLKNQEVDLLKIICENEPVSLSSLAAKMGVNSSNIESELELRLKELNLVANAARGRVSTDKGKKYIQDYKKVV